MKREEAEEKRMTMCYGNNKDKHLKMNTVLQSFLVNNSIK